MRSLLREPKPPYDDDRQDDRQDEQEDEQEDETPPLPERRSERCRACRGTGRIHVVRGGRDVGRARRCPACRGAGFVIIEES